MLSFALNKLGFTPKTQHPHATIPPRHSAKRRILLKANQPNSLPTPPPPHPALTDLLSTATSFDTPLARRLGIASTRPGTSTPLGPSSTEDGVNFVLFSQHAAAVTLCLFDAQDNVDGVEIPMTRTDNHWHCDVVGLKKKDVLYGFRVSGQGGWETGHRWDASAILLDPYAPLVAGRSTFGKRDASEQYQPKRGSVFRGTFDFSSQTGTPRGTARYDWSKAEENWQRPPLQDLVIYEASVRCYTADASSKVPEHELGTFAGMAKKAQHLANLGINAVELLPIFEYDELEFQRLPGNPRDHMVNIWGYSTLNFFAPMSRFGTRGSPAESTAWRASRELKQLVETLHAQKIAVILDVVYNHTAEGGDDAPYLLSFRGIDNAVYYMHDPEAFVQLLNYSGCGNTFNANHPIVKQLIIDSLVHFVQEYHVDGFRFDLASSLCRNDQGKPLTAPPLIRDIAKHPILSKCYLIAEPWDIGMYQVGTFPNWDIWAEWNGKFRDDVRRFWRSEAGLKGPLATRLAGSADLYQNHQRKPYHSINFVIAHDGFTLRDLVSYEAKRNDANGEQSRDGTNDNFGWNCGVEGETTDAGVLALRERQMRNLFVTLLLSQGTPMLLSGDEYGSTRFGNNNYYGHDQPFTWFQWNECEGEKDGLMRFVRELVRFRRACPMLGRTEFLEPSEITWHEKDWSNAESRFLAFTLHDSTSPSKNQHDVYVAMNAHNFAIDITLPDPGVGSKWSRIIDTNLPSPRDFTIGGNGGVERQYRVTAHSCIVLIKKRVDQAGIALAYTFKDEM